MTNSVSAACFNNVSQSALSHLQSLLFDDNEKQEPKEPFEEFIERRDRAEEMADGCEEDFILNWRSGK